MIVDDSLLFRKILSTGISSDPIIEVVATVSDAFDAINKVTEYSPDVITCDVEMPKMNGIEFIRKIMPQYPIPVVVISSISEAVLEAMNAGAVDFVVKPDVQSAISVKAFINNLIVKIKIASIANISSDFNKSVKSGKSDKFDKFDKSDKLDKFNVSNNFTNSYNFANKIDSHHNANITGNSDTATNRIIAIGASTGGTEAIYSILSALPKTIPGIVIVQHIPPVFSRMFADRLNNSTDLDVKEAETGDYVDTGKVLIAPGDRHMRVAREGTKYKVECFKGSKVNGHCPSVDVLFESVSKECGRNAIGIILTGMGYDGSKGLLAMRNKGARTIGQDEKSSVVYGMPRVAYNIGAVEIQVPLQKIPETIFSILKS